MWFYVYVLRSEKDGQNYTGYTQNLKLRFEQHEKGYVESTKNRRPLKLIYFEGCLNQNDALHREKILENPFWQNVYQEKAQIVFNRVGV